MHSDTPHTGCRCVPTQRAAEAVHDGAPSRRALLKAGLAAGAAAGIGLTTANARYAFGATTGDTLVVLSLRGGFDGMSALAPIGDPGYATLRPSTAVSATVALPADSMFGFHPSMTALMPWWSNGTLAAVVDVGQAAPTRSHFDAMAEMERAAPGSTLRTGWIDRMAGVSASTGPFTVTQVGGVNGPAAFIGPNPEMALDQISAFTLSGAWDGEQTQLWKQAIATMHTGAPALVADPVNAAFSALSTVQTMTATPYVPAGEYPTTDAGALTDLSQALADTARLIKAGVGLRVATIDMGHWDMHEYAGVTTSNGWLTGQLAELAQALAAFATDLGTSFADTTVITLSEFGRRAAQNGTGGFDHGHGNQVFLLGGGVRGGRVHGTWPGLSTGALVQGDLPGRTDYRNVIGHLLTARLGLSAAQVSSVFPGLSFAPVDVAVPR